LEEKSCTINVLLAFPLILLTYIIIHKKQGVALPITSKRILRQKKSYGSSNIETMQIYNLQKNALSETKILEDIITL
jgi:hypothetical protein